MNSDRLTMIRLAGVVCSPSPERRNENAMAKRVKLVTITSRPGAIDSTVSSPTSWTMRPLALAPACGSTLPRSIDWAWASPANPQRHAATRITRAVPAVLRPRMTSDGREARALAFSSHDQHFDQELRTLPPDRSAARSLRSSRSAWSPLAPCNWVSDSVRTKARMSSPTSRPMTSISAASVLS